MWINSMQREEPYLGLTCTGRRLEIVGSLVVCVQVVHGCRQLVS